MPSTVHYPVLYAVQYSRKKCVSILTLYPLFGIACTPLCTIPARFTDRRYLLRQKYVFYTLYLASQAIGAVGSSFCHVALCSLVRALAELALPGSCKLLEGVNMVLQRSSTKLHPLAACPSLQLLIYQIPASLQ